MRSINFRHRKLWTALVILNAGMLAALIFHGWEGWWRGAGYPYRSFLMNPLDRFSDYTGNVLASGLRNPYIDTQAYYQPFTYVVNWPLQFVPPSIGMMMYFFFGLAGLMLLMIQALEGIVENPWLRVGLSLLPLGLAYPILFCIDRGNMEILLAPCLGAGIYYYGRAKYVAGTFWFLVGICLKLYPIVFLIFLLRQRKVGLAVWAAAGFLVVTAASMWFLAMSPVETFHLFSRNLNFFTQIGAYENGMIEQTASPWNAYKVGLLAAANAGIIPAVNFASDGTFIRISYAIYSAFTLLYLSFLVVHAWFIEKEFHRCAVLLLLFLSMSIPSGADYRLLHVCTALAVLVTIKSKRPADLATVVLVALVLVPKKMIFFPSLGSSIDNYPPAPDISIQVILNPVFVLTASALLLYDGYRNYDAKWTALRIRRFVALLPMVAKRWPGFQAGSA